MKIANVLGLRQREKLRPCQRQRIFDEPANLELPRLDGDVRVLAQIHHGPVPRFVLSDRQARHLVPVRLTGPRRCATGEFDVDRALVERDLPLDISLTAFDSWRDTSAGGYGRVTTASSPFCRPATLLVQHGYGCGPTTIRVTASSMFIRPS
jgi:hypothetical protein